MGVLTKMTPKRLYEEHVSIIREAHARMLGGEKEYGVYQPEQCQRDLIQEVIEELLDVINYATMEIMKVRALRKKQGAATK